MVDSSKVSKGTDGLAVGATGSVVSISTGRAIDPVAEALLPLGVEREWMAHLLFVPEPLRLRQGPIPVVVRLWTDGLYEAHMTDALLYGEGEDEAEALDSLRANLIDSWVRLESLSMSHRLGRAPARTWLALRSMLEVARQ